MTPVTWEEPGKVVRQLEKLSGRRVQDPATRAWNLFNALYYKAGHVPWRLPRDPSQFQVSYVGISFYRDLTGQRLLTSTAQMFDERGRAWSCGADGRRPISMIGTLTSLARMPTISCGDRFKHMLPTTSISRRA
jgi:hypothetical protein